MPIIYQKMIHRDDAKRNPDVTYVFGDNLVRKGFGGLAKELRGEPNSIGVPTKKYPSMETGAFFSDADFKMAADKIDLAFARLEAILSSGKIVVLPTDGIGTERAQLQIRAPEIWAYLQGKFARLKKISEANSVSAP